MKNGLLSLLLQRLIINHIDNHEIILQLVDELIHNLLICIKFILVFRLTILKIRNNGKF